MNPTLDLSTKRFRIAFSFAGTKRDFVERTADLLAKRFGRDAVLYDKYHEAEFANADLAFDLPSLYKTESDLIVAVFCPDYEHRQWCGLEWRAIFSIIKEGGAQRIILSRYEHAEGKGLHGLAGFIELDDKTPDAFATLILERLALNEGLPKDHYTRAVVVASPPKTSIPHNLPRLQPFFGRDQELRVIADALDPTSPTWGVLIDGPGGMGKTSLAVRAAYDTSPELFDRIIFVSLKSRELDDDGVRDLSGFLVRGLVELFGKLAHELGRDDIVKVAEGQRPQLLHEALRGTRALLVLDNLESLTKPERDVLFTFIMKLPVGCKAILTSRERIGSGTEELILQQFDERAALQTLAELAARNPTLAKTSQDERRMLYHETGGKPLLLRWIAGQLGRGHCLLLVHALEFLRSCPQGNDPLEFIFGDLADNLGEAERLVLCALTYYTLPIRIEHIAVIAGVSEKEADLALRSLANRSLVVPNDQLAAFTLVPMVAEFSRKNRPDLLAAIGARLERRAYTCIMEMGYGNHSRFQELEAIWPAISPSLPLFLKGDNENLQEICEALKSFFEFQGRWDEWLAFTEKAELKALSLGDYLNAGVRAYHAGYIHFLREQADMVLACAERASAHWLSAGAGARERADAIRLRGIGLQLKGDCASAIAAYKKALSLHKSLSSESMDVVIVLNDLGDAEHRRGNHVASEEYLREAMRLARAGGWDGWEAAVAGISGNLAYLALARGDWLYAESIAYEALRLSEAVGRQELIAFSNHSVARALVGQGKASDALQHAMRAVQIYHDLGSPDLAKAKATLAECRN